MQTLVAFITFIVPGFISLRVYEALRGGEGRKIADVIVDVVIYSFATDVVWAPIVALAARSSFWWFLTASIVGFVVSPGLLGIAWFWLQRRLASGGVIADPTAKPWDKFFQRIARDKLDGAVLVTLADGRRLGGRYVDPGFVSSYPAEEQLHVGETWLLAEDGGFLQRVPGSYGFLVDKKDCTSFEFFKWSAVEATLPPVKDSEDPEDEREPPAGSPRTPD